MSRVGKVPIPIPDNVKVVLSGNDVSVQGPKGKLSRVLPDGVNVATEDGQILVTRPDDGRRARERHGLVRSLVNNMVVGVTTGYEKQLEIVGVGDRAELTGDYLRFDLGYSHPIFYEIPVGITAEVASPTKVKVSGVDKEIVGGAEEEE